MQGRHQQRTRKVQHQINEYTKMLHYFVIHLLHEKDQKKISREDGPVLNLFRAILESGYWIEAIRKKTVKDGIPTFGAEVFLDFSLPESN